MKDGATLGMGCLLVVAFIALVVFMAISGVNSFMDNRTTQLHAQADLEQARMERDHQEAVDWERQYQTFVASLMALSNDHTGLLCLLSGFGGVMVAIVLILAVELYWRKT